MSLPSFAIPGQLLGPASKYTAGPGTHIQNSQLCASILGPVVEALPSPPKGLKASSGKHITAKPVLSISRSVNSSAESSTLTNVLPEVDAVVLARVTRIAPRQATVAILVVGDTVCADEFQGVIRAQDVRATEKDKVKIISSFRPGDIVRAQVISLGDQSNYYLSTASNHLGVVMATSEAGNAMYPISWKEFKDPATGVTEPRKVAKPF
ncbi:MAG: exosome 3'-_5 exonuclease subunit ski4 (Csl4) [Candelina submexicana]|nr:MAG: exosome 3'->5 exonuclease subunit ski4 (Csl4) [Candelina submexicana]